MFSKPYTLHDVPRAPLPTEPIRHRYGTSGIAARLVVEANEKAAAEALRAHMLEISGDPQGSNPRDYLSEKDATMLSNFVNLANHIHWAGASVLELHTSRIPGKLVWNGKHTQPAKNNLVRAMTMHQVGETHRGYVIGSLSIGQPSPTVAVGDDGLLYSERSIHMLQPSYGDGMGRLPDADILEPMIGVGQMHGVTTGNYHKKLIDVLMAGIPDEALLGVDLHNFGLAA
jgi:hypothetical protein